MIKSIERFVINSKNIIALNILVRILEMIFLFIILKIPNLTGSPHHIVWSLTVKMSKCALTVVSDSQSSWSLPHLRLIQLACLVLSAAVLKCSLVSFVIVCYSISRTYPWSYNTQPRHYRNNMHINDRYEFILRVYRCECRLALHMKLSLHYVLTNTCPTPTAVKCSICMHIHKFLNLHLGVRMASNTALCHQGQ